MAGILTKEHKIVNSQPLVAGAMCLNIFMDLLRVQVLIYNELENIRDPKRQVDICLLVALESFTL